MSQPKVGIVLPTYNRAPVLARSITSVLQQTMQDFEVIIVDDGSSDDTPAVVNRVRDRRLVYHRLEVNQGVAVARNAGLALSRAPIIAFQDSDDFWLPQKLEQMLAVLEAAPEGVGAVYCGRIIYGLDAAWRFGPRRVSYVPAARHSKLEGDLYLPLLAENLMTTTMLLARRELVLAAGAFDPGLRANEDWDLALRLAQVTRFAFLDTPLIIAYSSPDGISRNLYYDTISFARIIEKHRHALKGQSRIYARHLYHVGRGLMRLGSLALARTYLQRAILVDPTFWKPWAGLLYSYGPRSWVSAEPALSRGIEREIPLTV